MTEIEAKFFEMFGIEPKYACNSLHSKELESECNNNDYFKCKLCSHSKKEYPEITSDILLELICFNNSHWFKLEDLLCPKNIETIKEDVLRHLLRMNEEYKAVGCKDGFWNEKIRALFEEGAEDE